MLHSLFLIGNFGTTEIILIIFVIVLLFGAKRIPELFRGMGQGVREFKDATKDAPAQYRDQGTPPQQYPQQPYPPQQQQYPQQPYPQQPYPSQPGQPYQQPTTPPDTQAPRG